METKGFYSPREQESIGNWKDNAIVWLNKVFNLPGVDSISQLLENCLILGFIARKLNTCGNQFEIDETCLLTEKDILSQRPLTTMVQDMSAFHKIQAKYVDEANRLSLSDLQLLANDALATKAAVCLSQIATNASKHIQGIPEFPQHPSGANLTTQHEESHHEKELKLEEDEEDDDDTCSYKDAYQSVGSDYNYDSCSSSPTIKHSARSNNSYKYDPVITPSTKLSNEARISFIDNTAFSPATTTTAVPSCNQLINNNNNPPDYDYYQYNPSEGEDMMKIPAMRRRENKHNTPISTTVDVRKDEMDTNIGNASNTSGSAMMMNGDPLESILSPEKMKPKHSQLLNSIMHAGCYDEAKQLFSSSSSSNNNNNKVGERRSNGGGYVKCHTPEKCREEGSGGGIEGKRGAWWQKAGLMVLGAAAGLVIAALNGGVRKGRRDDGKKKVVVRKHGWDSPLVVSRG